MQLGKAKQSKARQEIMVGLASMHYAPFMSFEGSEGWRDVISFVHEISTEPFALHGLASKAEASLEYVYVISKMRIGILGSYHNDMNTLGHKPSCSNPWLEKEPQTPPGFMRSHFVSQAHCHIWTRASQQVPLPFPRVGGL